MPVVEPADIQEAKDNVQVSIENFIALGSLLYSVVQSDELQGCKDNSSDWRGMG